VACGPGFWTQFLAERALAVVATDFNRETLDEARRKNLDASRVEFRVADAYCLPEFDTLFNGALAVDWFCHVPISRRVGFLEGLHQRLGPGARIVLCDQLPKEAPETHDHEGNHLQRRSLPDGSMHTVIKNFPTEQEMRGLLEPYSSDIRYRAFPEGRRWAITYDLR
jgi:demethylmenaquinone methyltransferase/2-methoxy-6-polyprenyl-1,4-benzoquinol methylase